MNKPFYIIIFLLFVLRMSAQQNLVYNGDFEIYDTCPLNPSTPGDLQIEHCLGWTAPRKLGTSDYFNVCNNAGSSLAGVPKSLLGFQMPLNGDGYCGFFASVVDSADGEPYIYREYLQTKLLQSLEKNKKYSFSFNVSHCRETSTHSLIKIGALFSSNNYTFNDYSPIYNTPQVVNKNNFILDSLNWTKIEGTFTANGTEEYLTIGYFENQTVDTLNNYDDEFNPYYKIASYYYVDGISLIELPCSILIPNVFTPNADNVNDIFTVELCDSSNFNLVIYNRWGIKLFETNNVKQGWDGRTTSGEICNDGSYFYVLTTETKKEKGFIQLIR